MQIDHANIANMKKMENADVGIPGLGKRLKVFRTSFGYSAQGLAEAIRAKHEDTSITRQVIFNIENGRKTDLSITELVHIADGLCLPYLSLVCDLTEPYKSIVGGPFAGKTPYEVIRAFDPRSEDRPVNDKWQSLCQFLDWAADMSHSLKMFNSAKKSFLREDADAGVAIKMADLIVMEEYLEHMKSDRERLRQSDTFVPDEIDDDITEAKGVFRALKAQYEAELHKKS